MLFTKQVESFARFTITIIYQISFDNKFYSLSATLPRPQRYCSVVEECQSAVKTQFAKALRMKLILVI